MLADRQTLGTGWLLGGGGFEAGREVSLLLELQASGSVAGNAGAFCAVGTAPRSQRRRRRRRRRSVLATGAMKKLQKQSPNLSGKQNISVHLMAFGFPS